MAEGEDRFNFTKRRDEKAEKIRLEQEKRDRHSAQLRREAEELAAAIPSHFSTGALAATVEGDVVTINKKGTGRSLTIGVVAIGKFKLQAHGGSEMEVMAANQSLRDTCDENEMMDAVEEWANA